MIGFQNSIGRKIGAAILGTTVSALVLTMTLNIATFFHSYRQATVQKANGLAKIIATSTISALDFNDPDSAKEVLDSLSLITNIVGATIFTSAGDIFASFGKNTESLPTEDGPQVNLNTFAVIQPIQSENETLGYIVLEGTFSDQGEWFYHNLATSALILIAVLAACIIAANHFRKKITKPIGQLTDAVREISENKDYSKRVAYKSKDEIGYLVSEFNSMLGKIETRDSWLNSHREMLETIVSQRTKEVRAKQKQLKEKNTQLVKQIHERRTAEMIREEVERINRHDLKSSLNLVIGYPELLLNKGNLTPEQGKYIKRIAAAGYRMLDMIQFHLDMFKMEQEIYTLKTMQVDLIEMLCSLEEEMALLLNQSEVSLSIIMNKEEINGVEEVHINGEMVLLRTMFRNLIKNGVEGSVKGGSVSISVESDKSFTTVSISNSLPVPVEVRNRFFNKYVTEGKEDGTGLGTYSAQLIAKTHNASIFMETSDEKGTIVSAKFKSITADC
ncbi:Signal transduction histidine kinase [Maridesulfovibrio ferrireducens]|uniref:histidine kinase n=1 Tax=Maridesulfovibrio ferrireducens TaxID=246191 RepID=A0A1G9JHP6_9BACT|nr:CHASE sensor domain-containing protein [Maridesulfovibrio ferrireducens]SDL37097.1 Signal transduction histidine kinase [Maridesulfovibrio ferrireducens]